MIVSGFFIWPEWLIELRVRFHKEGSTKMSYTITPYASSKDGVQLCAGIDTGKARLDVALSCGQSLKSFANTPQGHGELVMALKANKILRVGIEATGGYEAAVTTVLRTHGFEVQLFQPIQVRAYATFKLLRAKSDKIDACLIARCTAELSDLRPPPDPRLQALSGHLTLIDQIAEDIARTKIRREHGNDERVSLYHTNEIKRLKAAQRDELKALEEALRCHPDLAQRLDLITGIDGVGMRTAVTLVVRMPELGSINREQAASLLGAAPFIRESGAFRGERHVAGGRMRARTALFTCAQAAIQWNDDLKSFYQRLRHNGKHHRSAIMACTRKLVILINAILNRGTQWTNINTPKAT